MWNFKGRQRPDFAEAPGPGQESVWDYPRPPVVEHTKRRVRIVESGVTIADSTSCYRLMETASPPTWYVPVSDVDMNRFVAVDGQSMCEWKGLASYFALRETPETVIAWQYPNAREPFAELRNCVSFYPGRIECYVDDERVRPQPGQFYGGWVTNEIVGPFKGEPGTGHW